MSYWIISPTLLNLRMARKSKRKSIGLTEEGNYIRLRLKYNLALLRPLRKQ